MRRSAASARRAAALGAALCAVLLAGCAPTAAPAPSAAGPSAGAASDAASSDAPTSGTGDIGARESEAPGPAGGDPELDAFLAAITGHTPADPAALVAAVEAAGFPRDAIERTREADSLGAPVTFLEIAVLDGDSCIVGQVGDGEPIAVRASPLGGDRCLVGEIVTVD
ncbi:MAG: DUF6993 domain-containing protein [Actinomycetota bacterium]